MFPPAVLHRERRVLWHPVPDFRCRGQLPVIARAGSGTVLHLDWVSRFGDRRASERRIEKTPPAQPKRPDRPGYPLHDSTRWRCTPSVSSVAKRRVDGFQHIEIEFGDRRQLLAPGGVEQVLGQVVKPLPVMVLKLEQGYHGVTPAPGPWNGCPSAGDSGQVSFRPSPGPGSGVAVRRCSGP